MTVLRDHPTFTQQLNAKFRIVREGLDPVELELIKVGEFLQTDNQERFSIIFRGPLEAFLPQAIYSFEHDQMGGFDLFIVPINKKDDGFYYEAVFNRLRK